MVPATFEPFDDWSSAATPFESLSRNFLREMNMMKHLMRHSLPNEIRDVNFRPSSMNEYNTFTSPITYHHDGSRSLRLCYDVRGFRPEEIKIDVLSKDKAIFVEAKHEVKEKDHQLMRHFTRRYVIPDDLHVDLSKTQMKSTMTPDGNLVIEAALPRLTVEEMNALRDTPSTSASANQNVAIPIKMN